MLELNAPEFKHLYLRDFRVCLLWVREKENVLRIVRPLFILCTAENNNILMEKLKMNVFPSFTRTLHWLSVHFLPRSLNLHLLLLWNEMKKDARAALLHPNVTSTLHWVQFKCLSRLSESPSSASPVFVSLLLHIFLLICSKLSASIPWLLLCSCVSTVNSNP